MKSLYEVTRPIIETIALDGQIDIPIMYAYELYKPEIRERFDKGAVLDAWKTHIKDATVDRAVYDDLHRAILRGSSFYAGISRVFFEHFGSSSLINVVNSSPTADYGQVLFEILLEHHLLDEANAEATRTYVSWLGWAVELIQHLDDTTHTFTDSDIDVFTYWVHEVLTLLNRYKTVPEN